MSKFSGLFFSEFAIILGLALLLLINVAIYTSLSYRMDDLEDAAQGNNLACDNYDEQPNDVFHVSIYNTFAYLDERISKVEDDLLRCQAKNMPKAKSAYA